MLQRVRYTGQSTEPCGTQWIDWCGDEVDLFHDKKEEFFSMFFV